MSIKSIVSNNSVLLKNLLYSVFSHGLNYLIPIFTFPYLVRTIGVTQFGLVSFAQNISNYLMTIIIFGFHLVGTNAIAQSGGNVGKQQYLFYQINFARLGLLFFCAILLGIGVIGIDKLAQNPSMYWLAFLAPMGMVFQSEFFFQGIQQMKILTIANLIARLISLAIIFLGVKSPSDTHLATLGYGLGGLLSGIFCYVIAYYKFNMKWYVPSFSSIWKQLINSYHVFLSSMSVNFYSSAFNLLILGFVANNLLVGYYSIADRIFNLICACIIPVNQAFFPVISKLANENYSKYLQYLKKIVFFYIGSLIVISVITYFLSPFIVELISGQENIESVSVLQLLVFCMPLYPFGLIYTSIFIIHNKKQYVALLNGSVVLINLVIIYPMLKYGGLIGLAVDNIIIFVAIAAIGYYLIKKGKIVHPLVLDNHD